MTCPKSDVVKRRAFLYDVAMEKGAHQVVIFIGPPGAGKGTQADLLQEEYGFFHLESSKVIEEKFKNAEPGDPYIEHEKELWHSGKLNTPELVRQWILERIRQAATAGESIVFSGSPRTIYEAEGEIPVLEELYGPEHIHVINLQVPEGRSIERNSKRRICKANRHPIPNLPGLEKLTTCPKDGSELITRALDTPETIKVRLKEYEQRTAPIMEFLTKRGYAVITINGDASIESVHQHIAEYLDRNRVPTPQE